MLPPDASTPLSARLDRSVNERVDGPLVVIGEDREVRLYGILFRFSEAREASGDWAARGAATEPEETRIRVGAPDDGIANNLGRDGGEGDPVSAVAKREQRA